MKLIIDTNILISAIIKQGETLLLIVNPNLELITPAHSLSEIIKHKEEIYEKSKLDYENLNKLIEILFNYIKIINPTNYSTYLETAKSLIEDINDVPFLACALAFNCPIWSEDKHFKKQNLIKVYTTKEIINLFKSD